MGDKFDVGDRVRVNSLAVQRGIFKNQIMRRLATVKRFGLGDNTKHCAVIEFDNGTEDLLHEIFLAKVKS